MRTLRATGLVTLLTCACGLLAPDEDYFGGGGHSGGLANVGGSSAGGTVGAGGSDAGAGPAGASSAGAPSDGGSVGSGGSSGASAGGQSSAGDAGADAGAGAISGGGGAGTTSGGAGATSGGGAVGAGGAGTGGSPCTLAPTKMETGKCGACNTGTHTRTLTLNANCTYTEGAWSACTGVTAACTPGATSACTNGDSCGQRRCSDSCTWSACAPKIAGGCLRIRAGATKEGTNYRCCGASRWQFCLEDCHWSTACAACTQGAPDFCSDC